MFIKKTKKLRSFDFGNIEGLKKSKILNKRITRIMISQPNKQVGPKGESFNNAAKRSVSKIIEILKTSGNTVVVSHNSILNIIDLWNKRKRGNVYLSKSFRVSYTNNKVKKRTGSLFKLNKENGGIVYLIRHGETDDVEKNVYSTKNGKLTNRGIFEAKKIAFYLKDKEISSLYTSDLPRTVHTSIIILDEIRSTK